MTKNLQNGVSAALMKYDKRFASTGDENLRAYIDIDGENGTIKRINIHVKS